MSVRRVTARLSKKVPSPTPKAPRRRWRASWRRPSPVAHRLIERLDNVTARRQRPQFFGYVSAKRQGEASWRLRSAVNSIARPSMLPEPPDTHEKKMKMASGATPFAALVLHGPEKRSRERSDRENFSNYLNHIQLRARRELNPRPSDSKSDALSS